MTIRCLLIDDEPLALNVLKNYIQRLTYVNLVAACNHVVEAKKVLSEQEVDLVFLDINMPLMSGIDFIKTKAISVPFVFTTAHREFAPEAFELHALDYLVKPIAFNRFMISINRYLDLKKPEKDQSSAEQELWIKYDKKSIRILLDQILWVESMNDHVVIVTKEDTYKYYDTLKNVCAILPKHFTQIHRSFVVNTQRIQSFTSTQAIIHGKSLPIGRNFKDVLKLN